MATWVKASNGDAPADTMVGGQDSSGEPLYVARASHEGDLIPGKLVSSNKGALVSWNGKVYLKTEYEVLIDKRDNWEMAIESNIPDNAFPGGKTKDGEVLYVGRVRYLDSITTGKVQKSHRVCHIPFNGEEIAFYGYEVLVS